jgi:hypothetical protein
MTSIQSSRFNAVHSALSRARPSANSPQGRLNRVLIRKLAEPRASSDDQGSRPQVRRGMDGRADAALANMVSWLERVAHDTSHVPSETLTSTKLSQRIDPRTSVNASLWFDPLWEPIGQGALSPPPSLPRNADAMMYISKYRLSFLEASAAFNVHPDLLGAVALASGGRLNQESDAQTAQIRAKAKNTGLINAADMFTITQGGWRVGRMQLQISDVYAAIRKGNLNLPPSIANRMPHRLKWFDTLTARQQYQLCAAIATDDQAAIYAAASHLRLNAVRMVRSGGDSDVLNVNSEAHFDQLADTHAIGPPRAPPSAYRRGSQDTGLYAKIAVLSRGVVHQLFSGAEPKPLFFRGYHPMRYAP